VFLFNAVLSFSQSIATTTAGTLADLFRLERSASSVSDRLLFSGCYTKLVDEQHAVETAADVLRMCGHLIRWLEDLVESPPRRPGGSATPEERADDYTYVAWGFADQLRCISISGERLMGEPLYPHLSRPAQSAWNRLLTQHLPHLPLSARIVLGSAICRISVSTSDDSVHAAQCATATALFPRLHTGDLMFEVGGGNRLLLSIYVFRRLLEACIPPMQSDALTQPFFAGPFSGGPRRLALLSFDYILRANQQESRMFDKEDMCTVSVGQVRKM
jgi:hypothetical protein